MVPIPLSIHKMNFRTVTLSIAVFGLCGHVQSQSTMSVYVEPSVPTGTAVPGDYTGTLRPQVHFSPPQHFMNGKIMPLRC